MSIKDKMAFAFEDGDTDKGDLMRSVKTEFGVVPSFLKKERAVAFQAPDLLAYEHLLANAKVQKYGIGTVGFDDLRYPLQALSSIPGGHTDDWGVHMEDDMTESCMRDGIPPRVKPRN